MLILTLFRVKFKHCNLQLDHSCFDIVAEPVNKAFAATSESRMSEMLSRQYKRGSSSLFLLKGYAVAFVFKGLGFSAYSSLLEDFNEILDLMLSSGLVQKALKDNDDPRGLKEKLEGIGPQVLTIEDLSVAFQICCIPLAMSLVTFAVEISIFMAKSLWSALRERLVASALVTAFYER